jgi:hypothetical protein
MDKPTYTFKIGQRVSYYAGGRGRGSRTGPYTIAGIVRQPEGEILYRIQNRAHERLAYQNELKLSLSLRKDLPSGG